MYSKETENGLPVFHTADLVADAEAGIAYFGDDHIAFIQQVYIARKDGFIGEVHFALFQQRLATDVLRENLAVFSECFYDAEINFLVGSSATDGGGKINFYNLIIKVEFIQYEKQYPDYVYII